MKELRYKLLPKQTAAWEYFEDDTTSELGYGGAAGGGKTQLGSILSLFIALNYPTSRGGIARKELKDLRLTSLKTFFEIATNTFQLQPGKDFKYNQQDGTILFSNGSEIVLHYLRREPSDPLFTRLGSHELTWGWADESVECPEEGINIFKSRIGRKNKTSDWEIKPFFLETFNPGKGHVYKNYWKPFRDGNLPDYRQFVPALPGDNPHLPESYLNNLRRLPKIQKERLLNGNFDYDDSPFKLFNYDSILSLFSNFSVQSQKRYITGDIARMGRDKSVFLVWEAFKIIDILVVLKADLQTQVSKIENLREKHKIPKHQVLIDEDGVGGGVVDFGKYKGFVSNSTPKKESIGEFKNQTPNYQNLKTQCVYKCAERVNKNEYSVDKNLFSSENQEMLIEDLDSFKAYDVDSDGKKRIEPKDKQKEALGRSPDFGDAFIMREYFELTNSIDYSEFNYY